MNQTPTRAGLTNWRHLDPIYTAGCSTDGLCCLSEGHPGHNPPLQGPRVTCLNYQLKEKIESLGDSICEHCEEELKWKYKLYEFFKEYKSFELKFRLEVEVEVEKLKTEKEWVKTLLSEVQKNSVALQ